MSEIDWRRLADEHDRAPERDTDEWLDALARFDADADERERALDADPLLLFRGLPEEETGPADIEAVKQAVASMRLAAEARDRRDGLDDGALEDGFLEDGFLEDKPASAASFRYWPVAALLAVAVSVAGLTGVTLDNLESVEAVPTWSQAAIEPAVPREIAQLPLVENLDPELGTLMQIEDDGVSLVVVLGEDSQP